jgi:hypothetical protein
MAQGARVEGARNKAQGARYEGARVEGARNKAQGARYEGARVEGARNKAQGARGEGARYKYQGAGELSGFHPCSLRLDPCSLSLAPCALCLEPYFNNSKIAPGISTAFIPRLM